MVADASQLLDEGIYTPTEAALYARARPQTIRRWVHGDANQEAVIHARFSNDSERILSFRDLIQCFAIRTARQRISLQRVREAIQYAEAKYEFPLARRHRLFAFGEELLLEVDGDLVQVTRGQMRDQYHLVQIVEPFMEQLTFGDDGLARRYTPMSTSTSEHQVISVSLDPHRRFGQPSIEPYGVLAWTLMEAVESEGTVEDAAGAHGVPPEAVRLAARYFDSLTGLA